MKTHFILKVSWVFGLLFAIVLRADVTLEQVEAKEAELRQAYEKLNTETGLSEQLAEKLEQVSARLALTSEERSLLMQSIGKSNADLPPRIAAAAGEFESAAAKLANFQDIYDQYNGMRQLYLMQRYLDMVERFSEEIASELSAKDRVRAQKVLKQAREHKKSFFERSEKLKPERDILRYRDYRPFVREVEELVSLSQKASRRSLAEKAKAFAEKVGDLGRSSLGMLRMLPSVSHGAIRFLQGKPVLKTLRPAVEDVLSRDGYRFSESGRENLSAVKAADAPFTLYLINHANAMLDLPAVFGLSGDAKVMTNATNSIPGALKKVPVGKGRNLREFLVDKVESNPDLFVVGEKGRPDVKLVEAVENGSLRAMLVFPEGNISSGWEGGFTRPASENFSRILLKGLTKKGMPIQIVPVTLPNNYRLFNDIKNPAAGERELRTIIHKPISADTFALLSYFGGAQAPMHLTRQEWIDTIHRENASPGQFLGSPSIRDTVSQIDGRLRKHCPARFQQLLSP